MIERVGPLVVLAASLVLLPNSAKGQCIAQNGTGHFQGSAVSKEAGTLEVTLDLRCASQQFEGELVTPVGTYLVRTGTYTDGKLQLQLEAGTDSVSVELQVTQDGLRGEFNSGDDSGPIELRRTGDAHIPSSIEGSLHLGQQQWLEDIDFLFRELPHRHANAFHNVTREQFGTEVRDLKQQLPHANGDEMYVGLDRIANSIGDAHTYVEFPADMATFPLDAGKFGPDYRIVAVGTGFEKALGTRIVKIGDTPIGKAHDLAASMTPSAETPALADARIAGFLTMGISLHGLGIIPDRNSATYTLANDQGAEFSMTFPATPPNVEINWISLAKTPPLYLRHANQDFWYEFLPESRTLYCNFRGYHDLEQHAAALLREVREKNAEKLVIDLRQNSGGDYNAGLKYLIVPIASLPQINRRGHLFVLTGVNTFSAAMSNAAQFRQTTAALLVGEPIGERPNSYQEAREMRLPNSQLLVRYSTRYYEFSPGGNNLIRPDRDIPTTWEEYSAGRDPVLDWVLQSK